MMQIRKRMTACLMAILLTISFAACTPVEEPPATEPTTIPNTEPTAGPTLGPTQPSDPVQTNPNLPIVPNINGNLELEQLRIPGYDALWIAQFTDAFGGFETVQNASELADVTRTISQLGKDIEIPGDYDDAFFAEYYLIMIPMQSNSGSVRYEAELASDGDKITITVLGRMPGVGTADMADWLLLIPLSRTQYPADREIEITAPQSQGREDGLDVQDK